MTPLIKSQDSKKGSKKAPLKTAKEKKEAKREKKSNSSSELEFRSKACETI
jgi:hypothetical protein